MADSLRLSDAGRGDVIEMGGREYRLMIQVRGGWLCRIDRDGEHEFIPDHRPIDKITFVQMKRNPKARKAKGIDRDDPLLRRL